MGETHTKSWDEGPYDPVKHKPWSKPDRVIVAFAVMSLAAAVLLTLSAFINVLGTH